LTLNKTKYVTDDHSKPKLWIKLVLNSGM